MTTNQQKGIEMKPVIVCTESQGVIFGYAKKRRPNKRHEIVLKKARMCLSWPSSSGCVFGLGEIGPNSNANVSAVLEEVRLQRVSAVLSVTDAAESAWKSAPVQGR